MFRSTQYGRSVGSREQFPPQILCTTYFSTLRVTPSKRWSSFLPFPGFFSLFFPPPFFFEISETKTFYPSPTTVCLNPILIFFHPCDIIISALCNQGRGKQKEREKETKEGKTSTCCQNSPFIAHIFKIIIHKQAYYMVRERVAGHCCMFGGSGVVVVS